MSPAAPGAPSSTSKGSSSMSCSIRLIGESSEWRELVASSKARTLKSGLIQIVAEILERLAREGVLDRDDAWEYLANAREAWRSPTKKPKRSQRLAAALADDDADGDDER